MLRLALDGQLQLSVYFVNQAAARRGKMVPLSDAKKVPGIPLDINGKSCEPHEVILGLRTSSAHGKMTYINITSIWLSHLVIKSYLRLTAPALQSSITTLQELDIL